jgi:alpha-D-ribose 1-methylphosphonate 5-triphosphate synthase subunit PhnH
MVRETAFDEVFDSQATFRALLEAMSRPGRIFQAPARRYEGAPSGLTPHVLSILKTLCDHRVTFSVAGVPAREAWESYLAMNLATPARPADQGDYVLFNGAAYDDVFFRLKQGNLEFPESSATGILAVGHLEAERRDALCALRLSGPGIEGATTVYVSGLDPRYVEARSSAVLRFPLGIDLILVDAEARVVGIPRTSNVEMV